MTYREYITSAAWRNSPARMAELAASNYRCRGCNLPAGETELQVHHRTYENFGNEAVGDLTTLCIECHPAITDIIRRRRYSVRVPVFADVSAGNCAVPLFDPMRTEDWS